ncbi:MAG: hypothetical protein R6V78_11760, partial [Desulfosarcina sp.]
LKNRKRRVYNHLWTKRVRKKHTNALNRTTRLTNKRPPATCCLVNPDKERTVERAFSAVNQMATVLKEKYLR